MASHDISLRGNQRPRFPDLCVSCERERPGHYARFGVTGSQDTLGWTLDAAALATTGAVLQGTNVRVQMQVPCCANCSPALERRHTMKTVALYVSGALGAVVMVLVIIFGNSQHWPSGITVTLAIALLLAVLLVPVVWELRDPPSFTITPLGNSVNYEFKSEKCAKLFRALNGAPEAGSSSLATTSGAASPPPRGAASFE